MQRVRFLMWKELLELRQNPRLLPLVIVAPLIQLTLLGYAATTDVRNVPIVIADGDRSPVSRELIGRFEASRYFTIGSVVSTVNEIAPLLDAGRTWMAVSIPPGFGRAVRSDGASVVQIVADGTDSNSITIALAYATGLIASYSGEVAVTRLPPGVTPASLQAEIRVWFNPQLVSQHFMVPGVLALLLLLITATLGAMAIVREKELGTLEQLNVSPLKRWELVVGKLLPYAVIGVIDVCLVITVAVFWFEVPLRGSVFLLFGLTLVYLLSTLGLGLFISTVSGTQQQAMMTAIFFFFTPMIYLSGFIFPIENMPAAIQPFTYLIPLRYYLTIVRGIFLKGVGLETLWPDALALFGWGLGMLALATARSRKTLK
jgi:ABC-2 type transport system permease protein